MMDPVVASFFGFGALFALILLHVPISFAMLIVGVAGYALQAGVKPALTILAVEPGAAFSSFDLSTVPLFMLLGVYATKAGFSSDLYRAIAALLGHRRGGLAYATIGGSAAFGVICGSSLATAATFAKAALPEMLSRKYSPAFAAGTIAAGGALKSLIPPSLPMILYCIITKTFLLDLFLAAIIPAIISVVLNMLAVALTVRAFPGLAPVSEPLPWAERWAAVRRAWPLSIVIAVIFGGFYSGLFTINEAAAVAVMSMLCFALSMRRLTFRGIVQGLGEVAGVIAMVYLLVAAAFVFSYFINLAKVPEALVQSVGALQIPPLAIIALLLVIYLILGAIFDEGTAMLITTPFVLPIVVALGYSPIWWGVIMVLIIELGLILPPIGIIVILLHSMRPELSIARITLGVTPYIVAGFLLLAILVLFPSVTLVFI
jgi:C4-dicarboxylate transporter, DctM subunit